MWCRSPSLNEMSHVPFTEHCRNYENAYTTLQTEIQLLKDQVQELYRDLTKHHSIINTDTMGEVLDRSLHIDRQIASQYSAVETMRAMFEEIWHDTFQRVTNEQEIYKAQLHDLLQLKQENSCLTTIARQIGPFILSIAKVKERLEPRFQEPKEHLDDRTETMLKIYEDSTVTKENQDSDNQTCATDHNRNKNNRSLMLVSEDSSIKSNDYDCSGRQTSLLATAHHNEMPS